MPRPTNDDEPDDLETRRVRRVSFEAALLATMTKEPLNTVFGMPDFQVAPVADHVELVDDDVLALGGSSKSHIVLGAAQHLVASEDDALTRTEGDFSRHRRRFTMSSVLTYPAC